MSAIREINVIELKYLAFFCSIEDCSFEMYLAIRRAEKKEINQLVEYHGYIKTALQMGAQDRRS